MSVPGFCFFAWPLWMGQALLGPFAQEVSIEKRLPSKVLVPGRGIILKLFTFETKTEEPYLAKKKKERKKYLIDGSI